MSVRIKTEDGDIVVSGKGKDGKDGISGIPVPQVAEVGQVLAVKAVDENSKPTEWECVNGGGGSDGCVINKSDTFELSDFTVNKDSYYTYASISNEKIIDAIAKTSVNMIATIKFPSGQSGSIWLYLVDKNGNEQSITAQSVTTSYVSATIYLRITNGFTFIRSSNLNNNWVMDRPIINEIQGLKIKLHSNVEISSLTLTIDHN